MHTLKCKSIEELVEVVVETYELLHDCDRNVSFVAKYDNAKEILKELVFYDYDIINVDELRDEPYIEVALGKARAILKEQSKLID